MRTWLTAHSSDLRALFDRWGRLALLVLDLGAGEDFDLPGIHPDGSSAEFGRI